MFRSLTGCLAFLLLFLFIVGPLSAEEYTGKLKSVDEKTGRIAFTVGKVNKSLILAKDAQIFHKPAQGVVVVDSPDGLKGSTKTLKLLPEGMNLKVTTKKVGTAEVITKLVTSGE
ncbi:MAG: hypothetical protein K8T89_16940 [Planctomycetes bacterium]|nr:hypothetical protein [Planctomycetota bacterium]